MLVFFCASTGKYSSRSKSLGLFRRECWFSATILPFRSCPFPRNNVPFAANLVIPRSLIAFSKVLRAKGTKVVSQICLHGTKQGKRGYRARYPLKATGALVLDAICEPVIFRCRDKNIRYAFTRGPNTVRIRVWSSPATNIPVLIRAVFPRRR